jgi:4-carboxymuconolactone decarboxylase
MTEDGERVRREVLGDEHVDRTLGGASEYAAPFQEYLTRVAWGEVWARPGLDRRTRSCLTLALLTALGAENELPIHVRAAIRNGVSPEEIREVIIHAALYAGIPAGNSAFKLAEETLREMGELGGS